MTIVEKKRVYELREQGLGYKAIAKELSLTPSAVRCVCVAKEKDDMLAGSCKNCGLRITSIKGRKKRVFCSDKCRMLWWNNHKDQVNRKAFYTIVCKGCGKEFISYGNKSRQFCSFECYANSRKKEDKSHE